MGETTLELRVKQLQAAMPKLKDRITSACENATIRAVEKAAEMTPPTMDDLRGTNTRSGEMKQHWATDSKTTPEVSGNKHTTYLANDKDYSSYVNDGHRMDRHFVPGLYINPSSGLLEYDPSAKVGIVVGTKTSYVPGIHMVDAAIETYRETLKSELADIGEVIG